jgi:hypothetical protein
VDSWQTETTLNSPIDQSGQPHTDSRCNDSVYAIYTIDEGGSSVQKNKAPKSGALNKVRWRKP